VNKTTLDLTPYFTEERFRFIDADAFLHHRRLDIHETTSLPDTSITAVSYVWFGLAAETSQLESDGKLNVFCGSRGDGTLREDGGPINLKVLEYACRYASQYSAPYLWLDRLCIMQTSRVDKAWQISRMYDVYESSRECIVLPGGLQRLASVFEETSWTDRAWTFQEAILTWDYAVVLTKDWHRPAEEQHWLVDGECHWHYLVDMFVEGDGLLDRQAVVGGYIEQPRLILGTNIASLNTLRRIVEYKAYNHIIEEGEETVSEQTVRQLVLLGVAMRTSSRPVDMVFSILGSVGVQDAFQGQVQVGAFEENERFRATLVLVEAMMRVADDNQDNPDVHSAITGTLVDVPLWYSLKLVDTKSRNAYEAPSMVPTLAELASLLDGDAHELSPLSYPGTLFTREPLREWAFDVQQTEEQSDHKTAEIALKIPNDDFLKVFHGEMDRVLVQHEEEGVIQLCLKLDVSPKSPSMEEEFDPVIFGWRLKLDKHPVVRFYKFDISKLFE